MIIIENQNGYTEIDSNYIPAACNGRVISKVIGDSNSFGFTSDTQIAQQANAIDQMIERSNMKTR